MLNKKQLTEHYLNFTNLYLLPTESMVVVAGGAMVLMGLREHTSDIDITTTAEIFNRFKKMGKKTHIFPSTGDKTAIEVVEATDLIDLHIGTHHLSERTCTGGVWHDSATMVLTFKRALNRPKDQEDINALEKHLSRTHIKPW